VKKLKRVFRGLPEADGSPRREHCCGNGGADGGPDRTTPAEPNKDHDLCLMNSNQEWSDTALARDKVLELP
jgi:hypothetical protein